MKSVRSFFTPGRLFGWAVLLIVILLYFVPILMLIVGAFRDSAPGQPGSWSLQGFVDAFSDPTTWRSLGSSLWLAVVVGIISTLVAGMMAAIAASKSPIARLVVPTMVVALAMPPLFFALSWDLLGTPRLGLINGFLWDVFGIPGINIGGAWGTAIFLGLKVSTLVFFILLGPFLSMDRRQQEAAVVSGAGKIRVALTVTIPALLPALLGGFSIAFIIGVTAFDIPLILGRPEGFTVFSTQIYGALADSSPPNYAVASSLAMVLIAIVLTLVGLRWMLLDRRSFTTVGGKATGYAPDPTPLSRVASVVAYVVFTVVVLLLPAAQMALASLQPIFGAGALSLANYTRVLQDPQIQSSLGNTIFVAVVGGALAVLIAFVLALIGRYGATAMRRTLDLATWLPWAANGVLLGLGLVWMFIVITPLRGFFGTIWIVLLGLVIASTPLAGRTIDGAIAQIGGELEEAGRVSGAGVTRVAVGIVLRLMTPAVLAAWFISAIHIVGNLEVPILLALPTNRVMAVSVYQYWGNGQGTTAAALFCLVIGAGILVALAGALLMWIGGRILKTRNRSSAAVEIERAASAAETQRTAPSAAPVPERTPVGVEER
ncbi:iron ABC transporter permease [Microbacterium sp. NPDC077184]|uniref:ABC transporter permease n=1 Tax=Microbacterium sp. NPDC077184 TaxID=3154764 RepID=UPI0034164252